MIVLICVTLLFSVRSNSADTGASEWASASCQGAYCITLTKGEITAEAGLCVVIPCSFSTSNYFTPQHIVWYKCEPKDSRCVDSDTIFDTDENNVNVQAEFTGRVSLLEPDVSKNNCSIIINDLRESDSGSYQLRVNGVFFERMDGFTFSAKATVNVGGLSQKPTVTVPPLTEGYQTTLTCTAPGLCSGSVPEITWMWRKTGDEKSHITGNITVFKTEILTAGAQRHSSTLTFNTSPKHHNTEVTCKVRFIQKITTEETVNLNVTFLPRILRGSGCEVQSDVLTCACISEGLTLPTIKWPLLENHTEFSVITTVSNHTVNSTIILTGKEHSNTVVECVSSNENGDVHYNLVTITTERREDHHGLNAVFLLTVAVVSLIINLSFIICFVFYWNSRKKIKPPQEDRTYMSLQKTDRSSEYDVIAQPLN